MDNSLFEKLKEIDKDLRRSLSDEKSNNNVSMFHYTSPEGLKGILSDCQLWFSNANFLNDKTETNYIYSILPVTPDPYDLFLDETFFKYILIKFYIQTKFKILNRFRLVPQKSSVWVPFCNRKIFFTELVLLFYSKKSGYCNLLLSYGNKGLRHFSSCISSFLGIKEAQNGLFGLFWNPKLQPITPNPSDFKAGSAFLCKITNGMRTHHR